MSAFIDVKSVPTVSRFSLIVIISAFIVPMSVHKGYKSGITIVSSSVYKLINVYYVIMSFSSSVITLFTVNVSLSVFYCIRAFMSIIS